MDQIEFMRWLDSKEGEQFWEKDEKGEKSQILRAGWARAQIEYDRIKGLEIIQQSDLKVCGMLLIL